jgi:FlaA1/EpsC-like NDP-sugar epimerase
MCGELKKWLEKSPNLVLDFFENKAFLVTGGCGSIGRALVEELLKHKPRVVRVLDNDENRLFNLQQELNLPNMRFFIGDLRDKDRLITAMEDVDIVAHCGALKHIHLCELNPFEALKSNVIGTQNLIEATLIEGTVERFVTISTDKAVQPESVMGATKLLAEKLTLAAEKYKGNRPTAFAVVRFGNVWKSRGSVAETWEKQSREGKPLTITDPKMKRFFLSIDDAVTLILKALKMMRGGEIFVPCLKEIPILHLAKRYGEKYEIIGRRAGERIREKLMTAEEKKRAIRREGLYIIA